MIPNRVVGPHDYRIEKINIIYKEKYMLNFYTIVK